MPPRPHWDPLEPQNLFFRVARILKPYDGKKIFEDISHRKKVGLAISGILGLKSKMAAKFTEKAVRSSVV